MIENCHKSLDFEDRRKNHISKPTSNDYILDSLLFQETMEKGGERQGGTLNMCKEVNLKPVRAGSHG